MSVGACVCCGTQTTNRHATNFICRDCDAVFYQPYVGQPLVSNPGVPTHVVAEAKAAFAEHRLLLRCELTLVRAHLDQLNDKRREGRWSVHDAVTYARLCDDEAALLGMVKV